MDRTEADLMNQGLPKWPQHYVTGMPVTVEQAKEIIRRTDTFFTHGYDGNNHEYNRWVRQTLGMPPGWMDNESPPWPKDDAPESEKQKAIEARRAHYAEERRLRELFEARWHPIDTQYVHNSWVSCSFIGGPHGWCHPDGQIGFTDNVGKWPSIEDVLADWQKLAEAFPFLDIGATLRNGESCEDDTQAVVSIVVKNGRAFLADPVTTDVHAAHAVAVRRSDSVGSSIDEFRKNMNNPFREQGISDEWIHEWAEKFTPPGQRIVVGGPTK